MGVSLGTVIALIKTLGGGGGGSGSGSYSDLSNKPKINNVTLSGNKTAEDLGIVSIPKKLQLSTEDGEGNVTLLNSKLSTEDVILEPGEYPLDGSVLIDGHTLDLNGSKVYYTEYVADRQMFVLAGYSPCIKNGELVGVISGNNHGNTGIGINESSDVLIENIKIKDFSGRGISGNGNSQYGERTSVGSAASYSTNNTHVSPQIQMKNYKYVRTVGSYGFNAIYTVEPVTYKFYNSSDELIKTDRLPPSVNSEIPDGAAYMTVETETGKAGLEDGYIPYQVGFTNHKNNLVIKDCTVENCTEWGMANLFGDSLLKNVDVCSIDIEDHQATFVKIEDSNIRGNSFIRAFYASYKNSYLEAIRPVYGKTHTFINCTGIFVPSTTNIHMQPAICVIGGNMNSYYASGTTLEAMILSQLLITSGPVLTPDINHQLQAAGASQFLARYQGQRNLVASFNGVVQGTYIKRMEKTGPAMNIKTLKGSKLVIYADIETITRQVHYVVSNDVYGVYHLNGVLYPNTHTIYDSYFKPVGSANAQTAVDASKGTYVDCTFDASDYYTIDTNKDKDLKFINCKFVNLSQNQIAQYSQYASSVKLEFINCYFDGHKIETQSDVETYILANTANATIIVDGTTIVGGT